MSTSRAWGWVAALRAGATDPWHAWAGEGEQSDPWLPGAQQLELLRRLNLAAAARGTKLPETLVDRVVQASAPGRGRPDLLLVGGGPEPRFGPRPVDPAELPDRELVRVATGLIADDLVAADRAVGPGGLTDPAARPAGRRRPWAPSYRITGDPWLAAPVVADLARRGRPQRDHPATVYVLGGDLPTMLAHAWTERAFDEGGGSWHDWLGGFARHDRLPGRADLPGYLRTWAGRVGRRHVRAVLDPDLLPTRLRGRRPAPRPPQLGASAVDLVRRVGQTLAVLTPAERRPALLRAGLAPRLVGRGGLPLAVPDDLHDWVLHQAGRVHAAVEDGGYPVLGDPDRLLAGPDAAAGAQPDDAAVLALAVDLLLDPAGPGRASEEVRADQ